MLIFYHRLFNWFMKKFILRLKTLLKRFILKNRLTDSYFHLSFSPENINITKPIFISPFPLIALKWAGFKLLLKVMFSTTDFN